MRISATHRVVQLLRAYVAPTAARARTAVDVNCCSRGQVIFNASGVTLSSICHSSRAYLPLACAAGRRQCSTATDAPPLPPAPPPGTASEGSSGETKFYREHLLDGEEEVLTEAEKEEKDTIVKELTKRLSGPLADEDGNVPTGKDRPIAIEVDGPSHFYANSRRYTAYTKLKHRLLTRMGYKVLHVPYFEWRRLRGAREREDYMRTKLVEEPTEWLDPEDEKYYNNPPDEDEEEFSVKPEGSATPPPRTPPPPPRPPPAADVAASAEPAPAGVAAPPTPPPPPPQGRARAQPAAPGANLAGAPGPPPSPRRGPPARLGAAPPAPPPAPPPPPRQPRGRPGVEGSSAERRVDTPPPSPPSRPPAAAAAPGASSQGASTLETVATVGFPPFPPPPPK